MGRYYFYASGDFEILPIERKVTHPGYDADTYKNDLLLLKLRNRSTKTYITLNSAGNVPSNGNTLHAIGLGTLVEGGVALPTVLQEVSLAYTNNNQCSILYGREPGYISSDMLCAWEEGQDTW